MKLEELETIMTQTDVHSVFMGLSVVAGEKFFVTMRKVNGSDYARGTGMTLSEAFDKALENPMHGYDTNSVPSTGEPLPTTMPAMDEPATMPAMDEPTAMPGF